MAIESGAEGLKNLGFVRNSVGQLILLRKTSVAAIRWVGTVRALVGVEVCPVPTSSSQPTLLTGVIIRHLMTINQRLGFSVPYLFQIETWTLFPPRLRARSPMLSVPKAFQP